MKEKHPAEWKAQHITNLVKARATGQKKMAEKMVKRAARLAKRAGTDPADIGISQPSTPAGTKNVEQPLDKPAAAQPAVDGVQPPAAGLEDDSGGNGADPAVNIVTPEMVPATGFARTGTMVVKPRATDDYRQANVFAFVPKVFQFSSVLISTMKYITEAEWGWPQMSFDDWIDTYLYWTAQAFGVKLMAYEINMQGGNDGRGQADSRNAPAEIPYEHFRA